jgi:prevent-host-death family protein
MNVVAPFTIFSAKDAKARFGEMLDEALGRPVGITKHDRLTAYVVSKHHFEEMLANIERLEEAQQQG